MPPDTDCQQVEPGGFLLECPHCRQELRVARKYSGAHVECKLCHGHFLLDPDSPASRLVGFFAECPHCLEELRANLRYRRARVACNLCGGRLRFIPVSAQPVRPSGNSGRSPMIATG